MTGIIVSGLEKSSNTGSGGGFSIINFYLSRARRILPALIVLCLFTLTLGWFFLSSTEYRALGTHVITALGFFSNIQFWREAGYFDAASHEKLLLHTWSLSVEWQFYIILPLILLAIWTIRPGRAPLTVMVALGLLLSLLLSVILSPIKSVAAFYLLPTRAWEMLAGGLVYLLASPLPLSPRLRKALEGTGFALIIAAITLFDAGSSWPGWRALVPVIGTMLVLIAARPRSLWTGSRIVQWLGDCSYSLYLWHWPFAVALVYLELQGHVGAIAIGLVLTLVFGWLSYRLIETQTRTAFTRMPQWHGAGVLLTAILIAALPSLVVRLQQGIPGRLPVQTNAVFNEIENKNPRREECHVGGSIKVPECTYGGDQLGVIVIGDSHAASIIRSIEKALPNQKLYALDWTMSSCLTISEIKDSVDPSSRCGAFVSQSLKKQKMLPSTAPLVIASRTSSYILGPNEPDRTNEIPVPSSYLSTPHPSRDAAFLQEMRNGMIETACEFAKTRQVYMLRPIPELKFDVPKTMGRTLILGEPREVSISLEEYHQRNAFVWETQDMAAERCGVRILDPLPYLCRDGRCQGSVAGLPIYYDDDHLSERGGSLLIPMFRQVFTDVAIATEQSAPTRETILQDVTVH